MAARIGFIGLGNMGCSMAANLAIKKPVDLTVFDVNAANVDMLREKLAASSSNSKITVADDPAGVAAHCQTTVTIARCLNLESFETLNSNCV